MINTETYFLHGLDSSGQGTKGRFFALHFPEIFRPDFHGTLENRLDQLDKLCSGKQNLVFIGSSFGGLMATSYTISQPEKVTQLILLAPALNFEGFQPPVKKLKTPTILVVGQHDMVTPASSIIPLAKETFGELEIRLEEDDHLLHKTFTSLDWKKMVLR